jgi:hypothetical protein
MSSSYTDQPPPHDPRRREGYTPAPPAPEHAGEEFDVESVRSKPKLGSLAQKARGKKLKQARIVLFLAGVLLLASAVLDLSMFHSEFQKAVDKEILRNGGPAMAQIDRAALKQAEDNAFAIACLIDGAFFLAGILFFVLGALVYRFPVPVTIGGLVLFLSALGAGLVIVSIGGEPEDIARYVASGWLLRLVVIVGLASSIRSAFAYERERRAEEEYSFSA